MTTTPVDRAVQLAAHVLNQDPAGLFTDIDGTLSPIVVDPADARVPHAARQALRRLRENVHTVGVVSGRAALDARRMVRVGGIEYIGNHGMETIRGRHSSVDIAVQPLLPRIQACVAALESTTWCEGVVVEDKRVSITVHFRTAADPESAHNEIHAAVHASEACRSLRISDGRRVVNITPPVEVDKGTAIMRIAERRRLRGIVYLGDDVTDLDAFRALRELRTLGCATAAIAVVSPEGPTELAERSDATLGSVAEVTELLVRLSAQQL